MPERAKEDDQDQDEEHVYMNPTGDLPGAANAVRKATEQSPAGVEGIPDAAREPGNRLDERVMAVESGFRRLSVTVLTLGLLCVVCITAVWIYIAVAPLPNEAICQGTGAKAEEAANATIGATKSGGSTAFWELVPTQPARQTPSCARAPCSLGGFRNATFTTLNTTGRAGPTSLGDHYRGQDHEKLVTLQDGIQLFTVPETGNYEIEVAGAAGSWDIINSNEDNRGYGAMMRGTFSLIKGEVLKILVGQEGAKTKGNLSAGGGGGTFVTSFNNTPLIIAGGGGGMQWLARLYESCDGTTLTSGQKSYVGVRGRAGKPEDEVNAGGSDGHGATEGNGDLGGGGGGFLTNGGGVREFMPVIGTTGGEGGYAFVNGGKGGRGGGMITADGGFGGGGGAHTAGKGSGGGGGYSGGGRGQPGMCECAGGGGSFNAGIDTSGKNGTNEGPGYVVIVRLFD
ncbi:Hypp1640 [Branchiostoma lanceolatum]|uniref:Hypp1640 protein n=1 Tax=Branchiostoma lanceolatum TaxID=7740 RepID=A0A8K0EP47_BRALA|nr:Hypp1640 [Branchiostoma lanceolatum]